MAAAHTIRSIRGARVSALLRAPPLARIAFRSLSLAGAPPEPPSFAALGVSPHFVARLASLGITQPSPAQAAALPTLLSHRHAILKAETGSGKTIAYLLPLLEALRARIEGHDPLKQLLPAGLVVVPSQELVQQVIRVASALFPEHANMMRPCYGQLGVTRRQNAGLLVATPRAARENVNPALYGDLLWVVIDEADALLSGAFAAETLRNVLLPMKQAPPARRPAHIFVAATLPARGKESVVAFLDKYYPAEGEHGVVRIETGGSHRAPPRVRQAFWQIDATLPLTAFEVQHRERAAANARTLAEASGLVAPPVPLEAAAVGAAAAGPSLESSEDAGESGAGAEAAAEDVEGWYASGDDDDDDDEEEEEVDDPIARTMAGRAAEDAYLAMRSDEERYGAKVRLLTHAAVLEALLLPARRVGKMLDKTQAPSSSPPSPPPPQLEEVGGDERVKARVRAHPSNVLGQLSDGIAPSLKKMRSEARVTRAANVVSVGIDATALGELPGGIDWRVPTDGGASPTTTSSSSRPQWLHPFTPPGGTTRPKLSLSECAAVPPTLVFVNSTTAASALRRALAPSCPHMRVSELHSDVPEATRVARLADFAAGRVRVLVCTNVAARGLDLAAVVHVIQAEFATDAVGHMHRMGRTARAGAPGMVTSLLTRSSLALAGALVRAHLAGEGVDAAFSKNRSFRKARIARDRADAALALGIEGERAGDAARVNTSARLISSR